MGRHRRRYPNGTRLFGKVTNVTDYGCFVEIEPGVEGLVHVSEMDWTNKNVNPAKVVQVGDEVEVMVLDIDEERRRISLGMKQTQANPWEDFAAIHKKNDRVSGQIKSITDFGIFIGLDGGIDGLVHLSDISWQATGEDLVRQYKKGDRSRPSCWRSIRSASASRSASSRSSRIRSASSWRTIRAAASSTARSRKSTPRARRSIWATASKATCVSPTSRKERIEDATQHLKDGDKVEAKFTGMDRKSRMLQLSIRARTTKRCSRRWRTTSRATGRHDQARCAAQGAVATSPSKRLVSVPRPGHSGPRARHPIAKHRKSRSDSATDRVHDQV